jgi:DNA integrity scanning protein DisA with diadenylate cyclase activity
MAKYSGKFKRFDALLEPGQYRIIKAIANVNNKSMNHVLRCFLGLALQIEGMTEEEKKEVQRLEEIEKKLKEKEE